MELHLNPAATPASPSADTDLKDPNKYCSLCAASFNNPQMALQHYNGRKHQRNQARQELLKELGDDLQQGTTGNVQFGGNIVMYTSVLSQTHTMYMSINGKTQFSSLPSSNPLVLNGFRYFSCTSVKY